MSQLTFHELEQKSKPYFNFIHSLKSEATKEHYRNALFRFLRHYNLDTDGLAKASAKDVEALLIEYIVLLKGQKRSRASLNLIASAVTHFCVMNDINIMIKKVNKFKGENETSGKGNDRGYEYEEIQTLLNASPLRMKMIFLILSSTGQRIGSLNLLKLKHLTKLPDKGIYQITVYANNPDQRYITYCTPETAAVIDTYLEYRKRSGEVLTPDSYLIRQEFDMNDLEQIKKKSKPITPGTLRCTIRNYLVRSGIRIPKHLDKNVRYEVAQNHGFRKFFESRLIESDVNPMAVMRLVGHKTGLDNKSYFRPKEGFILSEYEKAIDALTINPENRLKRRVEKLEIEKTEIQALAIELERVKKAVNL